MREAVPAVHSQLFYDGFVSCLDFENGNFVSGVSIAFAFDSSAYVGLKAIYAHQACESRRVLEKGGLRASFIAQDTNSAIVSGKGRWLGQEPIVIKVQIIMDLTHLSPLSPIGGSLDHFFFE